MVGYWPYTECFLEEKKYFQVNKTAHLVRTLIKPDFSNGLSGTDVVERAVGSCLQTFTFFL